MTQSPDIDIDKVIRQVRTKAGSKGLIGYKELASFFPIEVSVEDTYALIDKLTKLGIKVSHGRDSSPLTRPRSSGDHGLLSREQEVKLARQIRHGHKRRLRAAFRCPKTVTAVVRAASRVNRGEEKLWNILSDFEGTKVDEEEEQARKTLAEVAGSLKRLQMELTRLCAPQARRKDIPNRAKRIAAKRGSITRLLGKLDFHEKFLAQLITPIRAEAKRVHDALANLDEMNRELGFDPKSEHQLSIEDTDAMVRKKLRSRGLSRSEVELGKNRVKKYRRTIKSASIHTDLSTKELLDIAAEIILADREADKARHKLVESNQRLVMSIARRYPHHSMDFLDLVQEGNLGLMRAADRFDPDRGFRFGTYAAWWVRQSIGRLVAEQGAAVRIPPHVQESLHKLNRITRRIVMKTGKEPSVEELAEYIGKPPARVAEILTTGKRPVSTDAHVGDGDNTATFMDFLPDPDAVPDEEADLRVQQAVVQNAMSALTDREQDIISLRFQDGLTLQEVGEKYNITRERTRQIQQQALKKLKKRLKADLLRRMVNSPGRG